MNTLTVYHHPSIVARSFPFFVFRKETRLYVNEKIMLCDGVGREIGPAKVLRIERVSLWDKSTYNVPKVTDDEAKLIRRVNRIKDCAVASTTTAACVNIALGSKTIEEAVDRFMAKHGG